MWHSVSEILQPGWRLDGGESILDVALATDADVERLSEDLFRIKSDDGVHVLAVGWWPGSDRDGRYRAASAFTSWPEIRSEATSRDYLVILHWLEFMMKRLGSAPTPYRGLA